jgi:hypothetical protein
LRASTDESPDIGSVSLVHWYCDWSFHSFLPCSLEIAPPSGEFSKAAGIVHDHADFSVISWCQFRDHDPYKQVYTRHAEVMEIILLHMPPTTHERECRSPDIRTNSLTVPQPSLLSLGAVFLQPNTEPKAPTSRVDTNFPRGKPTSSASRGGSKTHIFASLPRP